MTIDSPNRTHAMRTLGAAATALVLTLAAPLQAHAGDLVQPKQLIADSRLSATQLARLVTPAREYDTFWTTCRELAYRGQPHLPSATGRSEGLGEGLGRCAIASARAWVRRRPCDDLCPMACDLSAGRLDELHDCVVQRCARLAMRRMPASRQLA